MGCWFHFVRKRRAFSIGLNSLPRQACQSALPGQCCAAGLLLRPSCFHFLRCLQACCVGLWGGSSMALRFRCALTHVNEIHGLSMPWSQPYCFRKLEYRLLLLCFARGTWPFGHSFSCCILAPVTGLPEASGISGTASAVAYWFRAAYFPRQLLPLLGQPTLQTCQSDFSSWQASRDQKSILVQFQFSTSYNK